MLNGDLIHLHGPAGSGDLLVRQLLDKRRRFRPALVFFFRIGLNIALLSYPFFVFLKK